MILTSILLIYELCWCLNPAWTFKRLTSLHQTDMYYRDLMDEELRKQDYLNFSKQHSFLNISIFIVYLIGLFSFNQLLFGILLIIQIVSLYYQGKAIRNLRFIVQAGTMAMLTLSKITGHNKNDKIGAKITADKVFQEIRKFRKNFKIIHIINVCLLLLTLVNHFYQINLSYDI